MTDRELGPIQVVGAGGRLALDTRLPGDLARREEDAVFSERVGTTGDGTLFLGWSEAGDRCSLVVTVRYDPAGWGFTPGVLSVPETGLLFVGAGTTLLCYSVGAEPRRLWADEADFGFWSWRRAGDRVLMAAELELAAWDLEGRKLWSTFVEPPWDFDVVDRRVELDVMGTVCAVDIDRGPDWSSLPWR